MADAVAAFYSQPSGQQRGGGKELGVAKKFAIPLWRNVKDKLCEKIPSVAGKVFARWVNGSLRWGNRFRQRGRQSDSHRKRRGKR